MTATPRAADWSGSVIVLSCLALLTTIGVATPGLWVSLAALQGGSFDYRSALRTLTEVGAVGGGVLACFSSTRLLGALAALAYVLVMTGALAGGQLSPGLALPLAAIYGALRICVWAVFFERISTLGRYGASLMLVLNGTLHGLVFLFAGAALTPVTLLLGKSLVFALAMVEAVLVGGVITLFGDSQPRAQHEQVGGWSFVVRSFFVWWALQVCTTLLFENLVGPTSTALSAWRMAVAGLVVQLFGIGTFAWLGTRERGTLVLVVAAWFIACSAALLAPLSLMACWALGALGGVELAFPVGIGSGAGSVASSVLLAVAGLHTPARFRPLVVACWFMVEALSLRAAGALLWALASEITVRIVLIAAAGTVLAGCFVAVQRLSRREPLRAP